MPEGTPSRSDSIRTVDEQKIGKNTCRFHHDDGEGRTTYDEAIMELESGLQFGKRSQVRIDLQCSR